MKARTVKTFLIDLLISVAAGVLVAVGLYYFANYNHFYPGGISGLAFLFSDLLHASKSLFLMALNLPLFVAVSLLVDKKLGFFLSVYLVVQSVGISLLERISFPYYQTQDNLIFAALGAGAVTGLGYALMLQHFGASGGTFAISALIKRRRPGANVAWLAFVLDSSVVVLVFCFEGFQIEPALCTLINLFLADAVVDEVLRGGKSAYRFEIVTNTPEALAADIMQKLGHGVTMVPAEGMYTHKARSVLICIVRKRHVSDLIRLLRTYPNTFASFSKVNEVLGRFHK